MTKKLYTKQGECILVDDEDFDKVSAIEWVKYPSCRYIQAHINGKTTSIHRYILGAPDGSNVDHINGDRMDNRKNNLRFCTHAQNMKNRKPNKEGKSAYKGIVVLPNGRYRAKINSDGKRFDLGVYESEYDAVIAYNAAAKVLHGEHCYLNQLPDNTRNHTRAIEKIEALPDYGFIGTDLVHKYAVLAILKGE